MSNKTKSRFLRNRTLSRFAALGGTAIIVSSLLMTVVVTTASAAGTGAKLPTTTGTANWTNPTFAFTDNGQNATVRPAAGTTVSQVYGTFGFPTLPAGSIIDGITVNIEASATDTAGCSLVITLDGDDTVRSKTLALTAATSYTLGSATDPWGTSGTDWDPTQLTNANFTATLGAVDGDSCNDADTNNNQATFSVDYFDVAITYRTIDAHSTNNPALDDTVCDAANFTFVIDMSGSIAAQGNIPSNLGDMVSGIKQFVTDFEMSGDGKYAATRFNAGAASNLTAGFIDAGPFQTVMTNLGNQTPSGLTPTQLGIDTGDGNIANPGPGQLIMFVITDGSPNVPNTHGDDLTNPDTWLQGANGAIAAADVARNPFVVKAFYVSQDGPPADPGDANLPFSPAGDSQWAQAVMTQIGGGSFLPGDFDSFTDELFEAIHCEPDIRVVKDGNGTIQAGAQAAYTIEVKNIGDGTAHNVELTDNLPAGIVWAEDSPECSIDTGANPDRLNCNFEDMIAGEIELIHLTGTTDSGDCGALPNTASATSSNEPSNVLGNNQDSATITVICAALDLTKTADAATVSAGSQIGFRVTIANTGAGTATGLSFTDALPGGTGVNWSIESSDAGWSITGSAPTQTLVYAPTTLAGNTDTEVHVISGTTSASCKAYVNNASVSATNDGSDQASATTTVQCPALDLTKTADALTVNAGSPIGFTVTIANTGAGTATGLSFTDNLPAGPGINWSIPVASAGWSITGAVGSQVLVYTPTTLAGNTSTSVHVVSATTSASCLAYPNSASVTAGNTAGDQASATTTVQCPALDLTKTADALTVNAGSPIGFTVTIANTGAGTATGLSFTDNLPAGPGINWSIPVASAGWSITGAVGSQVLVYTPTTLAGNTSTSVHVVSATTSASCLAYPNSASVTAGNTAGDQASATTTVQCPALDLTKTADALTVNAGSPIGFTVTIANTGAGTATGLSFTDNLPAGPGINWSIPVASAGWSITGAVGSQVLVYTPTTLAGNTSTSVHVVSATTSASCLAYPNSASVTAGNTAGDQASATTTVQCPDIDILKVADDDVVNAGESVGFSVTISNAGPGQATGVHVTDTLPTDDGLDWTLDDNAGGLCALAGGIVTCDKATLDVSETIVFHVSSSTTAATAEDSPVENDACVTTTNDGEGCDGAQTDVLGADIQIVKVADDEVVDAGDLIGFTITVFNNGDGAATGVHVSDLLPTDLGLSWTAGPVTGPNAAGATCAIAAGSLTCDTASLPSKGSFSVHIGSPTTWATAASSPVDNTAAVTTTNDGSDESSDDVEILAPAITIDKLADDEVVNAGESVGFTVTIGNSGPGIAKGVLVTDTLPTDAGLSWILDDDAGGLCELASGVVTCEKDVLAVGDSFSFHVTSTTTAATVADSSVENEACVTAENQAGGDCDDDETEVLGAEIDIVKLADDDQVAVGETIGFRVTVSNNGEGQAKDVHVTDTLPTDAGLSWILDDDAGGLCALAAGIVTCDKDTLDSGDSFSFHVTSTTTVATAETSPVENEACVATSNDGEACAGDEVGVSSLVIDKSNDAPIDEEVGVPTAPEGSTVTYTLDYTFSGDPVSNGVITDVLPEGVTYVVDSATDSAQFIFDAYDDTTRTLTWKAATVSASGSLQYKVTVDVDASNIVDQPLTNTATIDSDQTEPDSDTSDIFVPAVPAAETSKPTPPQTDVFDGTDGVAGPGMSLLLMFGILGGLIVGLAFITPVPEVVRRRRR